MPLRNLPYLSSSFSTFLLISGLSSFTGLACKKADETQAPAEQMDTSSEDSATSESEEIVPQDPDPEQIATSFENYLQGRYDEVESVLSPLVEELTLPAQHRASAIASSILALSLAEHLPENAKDHIARAKSHATHLDDAEVRQMINLAEGVYLVGVSDASAAQPLLDEAVKLSGMADTLAQLALAECLLNQAFNHSDRIEDPAKLEAAAKLYQSVVDSSASDIYKAHAEEGMAALANYQHKAEEVCPHAAAAQQYYKNAGAHETMLEVSTLLANEARCSDSADTKQ